MKPVAVILPEAIANDVESLARDWMIKISNLEQIGAADAARIYRMCRKDLLNTFPPPPSPTQESVKSSKPCIHCKQPSWNHATTLTASGRQSCADGYGWHEFNVFTPAPETDRT